MENYIFISYSHDSDDHIKSVLSLADRLKSDGIEVQIDENFKSPSEGWARWSAKQIEDARFVLVICTKTYHSRFSVTERQGLGKGVKWEGAIITQDIYESDSHNSKYIPIIFSASDEQFIPLILRQSTNYKIYLKNNYAKLLKRLNEPFSVEKIQSYNLSSKHKELKGVILEELKLNANAFLCKESNLNSKYPFLVKRPKLVDSIIKSVNENKRHIILGMPATGKTILLQELINTLTNKHYANVFYFDLRNISEYNDLKINQFETLIKYIQNEYLDSYILIDNIHLYFDKISKLIRSIINHHQSIKFIATLVPIDIPKYFLEIDNNIVINSLDNDKYYTQLTSIDILKEYVYEYFQHYQVAFDEKLDIKYLNDVCNGNLHNANFYLKGLRELLQQNSKLEVTKKLIIKIRETYLSGHLQRIYEKYEIESLLALAAIATWSQYEIAIEKKFLTDSLGISPSLIDSLVVEGEVERTGSLVNLLHRSIGEIYINTLNNVKVLETIIKEQLYSRYRVRGNIETNLINIYLLYKPMSIELISKQLCNHNDVMEIIAGNSRTIDAIFDMILEEKDIVTITDIFVNFEWQNSVLSTELMKRFLKSKNQIIEILKRQDSIAPIIAFLAPMWFVMGDSRKKSGKKITYNYNWKAPLVPIKLKDIECKYIVPFDNIVDYRKNLFEKLNTDDIPSEIVNEFKLILDKNPATLLENSCICAKAMNYSKPNLCAKLTISQQRPGTQFLKELEIPFLVRLINRELLLCNIVYSLNYIVFFDFKLAKAIIDKLDKDKLLQKMIDDRNDSLKIYLMLLLSCLSLDVYTFFIEKLPNDISAHMPE